MDSEWTSVIRDDLKTCPWCDSPPSERSVREPPTVIHLPNGGFNAGIRFVKLFVKPTFLRLGRRQSKLGRLVMQRDEALAELRAIAEDKEHSGGVLLRNSAQWILTELEWQPIETAPKDDAPVDLWIEVGSVGWRDSDCCLENGKWVWVYDDTPVHGTPTHWRPVPKGPGI